MVGLVVGFSLLHCASLLLAMLPRDWKINAALAPYRHVTGTEQEWGMFYTIPTMQSKGVTVVVFDESDPAAKITAGPILPGRKLYDVHSKIRYYYLFNQLTNPDRPYLLAAYLENMRRELESGQVMPAGERGKFSLEVDNDLIRLLVRIREDGKMTVRTPQSFGPHRLDEKIQ